MPDTRVTKLAEDLFDEEAINWDAAESNARGNERVVVRQLRLVAAIGETARKLSAQWGPFPLYERIGHGSFGTVYRSQDAKLGRTLALKLLDEGSVRRDGATIREARLLAEVEHPNIVTVYGADEHDGRVGIWMKFIAGKTLKALLEEQGPLGAEEAARIGRDLCQALAAVHKRGVVHRDIKAQNVMREVGGRIVLMDFGAGDTLDALKSAGVRGTPASIAPEVLAGQPATPASDIYSLGVLLFHLVTGSFPVTAESWQELRDKHARGQRTLLRDLRPDLPDWFVDPVERAISTKPEQRPASAGELGGLLANSLTRTEHRAGHDAESKAAPTATRWTRRLALAYAVTVLSVTSAVWSATAPAERVAAAATDASVLVRPFTTADQAPESDFFSRAVATEIAANLAKLGDIRVVTVDRDVPDLAAASRELGFASVLEGSTEIVGPRIQVSARLIRPNDRLQLWGDVYNRTRGDLPRIQSDISRQIALALKGHLAPAEAALLRLPQYRDTAAFQHYVTGRFELNRRTESGFRNALRHFQDALAADPRFAPAHAANADAYMLMGVNGFLSRSDAQRLALASAQAALAIDDGLAEAHAALGYVQKARFEWAESAASLREAIRLRPGYALAHQYYGVLLTQFGRFSEALTELRLALSYEPLSISANAQFAATLLHARHYDDAIRQAQLVLAMDESRLIPRQVVAEANIYLGNTQEALAELQTILSRGSPGWDSASILADYGVVLARLGRAAEARQVISRLRARLPTATNAASSMAIVHAALGETQLALGWLREAMGRHESDLGYLLVEPKWDSLRHDPEFERIVAETGLQTRW